MEAKEDCPTPSQPVEQAGPTVRYLSCSVMLHDLSQGLQMSKEQQELYHMPFNKSVCPLKALTLSRVILFQEHSPVFLHRVLSGLL